MHVPHHSTSHPPTSDKKGRIMDPVKLMARRYSMMIVHFCILLALIFVATFQVRSAILLGINTTSAAIFLIYVPRSAYLAWREGRNGIGYGAKVRKKGDRKRAASLSQGEMGLEEWDEMSGERRGWTWDCAGLEVVYLATQCTTTLVASILCALTLSSAECFGPPERSDVFILDEFANLKERGADSWCHGVVAATVMSFVQFAIDLAWLGWVISVIRVESGVRGGRERVELHRRISGAPEYDQHGSPTSPTSPMSPVSAVTGTDGYSAYHPKPHAFHLLQTLRSPTPRLLTALAQRRAAAEAESQRAAAEAAAAHVPGWGGAPTDVGQQHQPQMEQRGVPPAAVSTLAVSTDGEGGTARSLRPEDLEVDVHPHGVEGGEILPPYVAPPYVPPPPPTKAAVHQGSSSSR